jgi:DNA repair ATPase RecN
MDIADQGSSPFTLTVRREIMKKGFFISAVFTALVVIVSCGGGAGGKYADFKALLGDELKMMNDFVANIDKAANADDMTRAMDKFNASLKEMAVKIKDLEKKYPELKDLSQDPPELKNELDQLDKVSTELEKVLMKKAQYMVDPKVMKAYEDIAANMGELGL